MNDGTARASFLEEGCAPTFQFLSQHALSYHAARRAPRCRFRAHHACSLELRRAPLGTGCLNALVLARKTYAAGVFRLPSCALERSTHGRNDVVVTIADPETGLQHTCGAETPLDILD